MKTIRQISFLLVATMTACSTPETKTEMVLTEALPDASWQQSCWISAVDAKTVEEIVTEDNFSAAEGASWFVSDIVNPQEVKQARWMTTGLGIYEIYVNGQEVGKEYLKPGFTYWSKTRRSFTYDITGGMDLKCGAINRLSAQLTPGWWADKIITPAGTQGMFGKKTAFRAVLELTFADGSTKLYGTNLQDWKAGTAGPVLHASIYDGEEYDARIKPGYETPELLAEPEENQEFSGEILPTCGAEIYLRNDIALNPVKSYIWNGVENVNDEAFGKVIITREYKQGETMIVKSGETLVVDFGQNAAAIPSFCFKANEGTTLTCLPAELLNDGNGATSRGMDGPEGSVHRLNFRIPDKGIRIDYTFSNNDGFVNYHPTRSFFGYRYVSITATDEVEISSLQSIPVSSIAQNLETGTIVTGNDDVNKLIQNTLWGQRSNYLSVPTDCPQRNERLGWTADTQVYSETGTFFANTCAFFHKWTRDLRDTQSPLGAFPGVAPWGQYGTSNQEMMRLGWADAGIIVPWTVWKQFGDNSIIEENWDAMVKFIGHINETKYNHTALAAENGNYQWADWLSYEPLESRGLGAFKNDKPLPDAITYWNYLGACYWIMDASMMCDMAKATGRNADEYEAMVKQAKEYTRSTFLNNDGTFKTAIFNTMQTPALFAMRTQLVKDEALESMKARLRENFTAHGNCLQTGFLGTSILMPTLTDNGMGDIAYELLLQHKNPSWLYSIDNGATTIWERWNSYTKEKGMGPKDMNSFNHYAYGCVCQWLWENVAGIKTDTAKPGFQHIIMSPLPDKRLGSMKAEYQSAAGTIVSEWKYESNQWIWNFTIPQGATASVILPGTTETKEYEAGSYTLTENLAK